MGSIERIQALWRAKPLVQRLVAMVIALLALGLVMAATVMIGLLQRHLTQQIDEQLVSSAQTLANQTSVSASGVQSDTPTPYYIRRTVAGQSDYIQYYRETIDRSGTPQIPQLLQVGQVANTANGWTNPVTVRSDRIGSTWRAIAIPIVSVSADGSRAPGVLTIALPLTDVRHTLTSTALYFLITGLTIVALGGTLGFYLVRHSLSPLRAIESTAGKIAAGDLTQRIEAEPPTTEVGSLTLSLNTMLSQVEQSFEAREASERKIRRFVSDASHELRTPLAAIRGYGELYSMGGVPTERVPEVMGRIRSEATRMGTLVEDLLTLARLDEGRPLEPTDIDLVKMADNAAFDLQALDPTRGVSVQNLSGRKAPMTVIVPADRDRIQQVFTNIVGNIDRYTPEGSPVELALGTDAGMAVVEFRDHGPGIASSDRERVFERFYRAENSRNRSLGGSGLGLAIVSGIITAHHGSATLLKTAGGGLTVRIELPLSTAPQRSSAPTPLDSPTSHEGVGGTAIRDSTGGSHGGAGGATGSHATSQDTDGSGSDATL